MVFCFGAEAIVKTTFYFYQYSKFYNLEIAEVGQRERLMTSFFFIYLGVIIPKFIDQLLRKVIRISVVSCRISVIMKLIKSLKKIFVCIIMYLNREFICIGCDFISFSNNYNILNIVYNQKCNSYIICKKLIIIFHWESDRIGKQYEGICTR